MFSTLPKTIFKFSVQFILLSANAFNLDQSKILLFGKELKRYLVGTLEFTFQAQLTLYLSNFFVVLKSRMTLNLGYLGHKLCHRVKVNKYWYLVGTLEATFIAQFIRKFVRMFVLIQFRMSLNLPHLWSKTRSVGRIKDIYCGRSRGHISCSDGSKIGENV